MITIQRVIICKIVILYFAYSCCFSQSSTSESPTWYDFTPQNDYTQPSLIGLEDWNVEPAGRYGRIVSRAEKLLYQSQEIKIWGINNTYGACAPTKELADKRAAFYRKFGINAVRLHKYADRPAPGGIQSLGSFAQFEADALQRMDYYVRTLKENGIYTKLSPTFGVKFGPEDTVRIPFYRELGEFSGEKNRIRATYGAIYLSEELQNLQIDQTIRILQHKNPYTGLTYAEDPAIFCVELFNEDAVLWYGGNWSLQRHPTLRRRTAQLFSQWLTEKYGTEQAWRAVWGSEAILYDSQSIANNGLNSIISVEKIQGDSLRAESLSSGTVVPWFDPGIMDTIVSTESDLAWLKPRLLDAATFLIGLQNTFYDRFIRKIRQAGYQGEIVASNWQAGATVGHLLNLHSDSQAGIVDRHNYFGGNLRGFTELKEFANGSLLEQPGIGTLSVGFQQVAGHPFMLSEWVHVQPNEWYAEGPALLGAYGWGLQGWDASFMFQNRDDGQFSSQLGLQPWDVSNPAIMILFPAVARQVRRGDVTEAPQTHHLNAHIPSIQEGKLGFIGQVIQQHDVKTFSSDKLPPEALAALRVMVNFTDEFQETNPLDSSALYSGDTVVSSTGQLRWVNTTGSTNRGGYVTINTPATKAFIGFAPGDSSLDLGDGYRITPKKGFSVIYLTAPDAGETLGTAKEIIVTAMARVRNTGMELNEERSRITTVGEPPLQLEPVRAEVEVPFKGNLSILDHDGNQSVLERPFQDKFSIDGEVDKSPFYLITKNQ